MITFFGATSRGVVREKNEDDYLVISSNGDYPFLFAVADGIGGLTAGEIASKTAVDQVKKKFLSADLLKMDHSDIIEFFNDLSRDINKELLEISEREEITNELGTTLSIMLLLPQKAIISHIGDSLIFKVGDELEKLTDDHTFVNELLKKNEISEAEARIHPKRNLITKALGSGFGFYLETKEIKLEEKEIYILCTDGLFSNRANEKEVLNKKYLHNKTAEEITTYLMKYADEAGGKDNTTIITLRT